MSGSANTRFATAVHAVALLAVGEGAGHTSGHLAGSAGVSAVYMRRVLGTLRDDGLVASRSGASGGWRLLVAPERLPLDRVWRAAGHPDGALGLNEANPACPAGQAINRELAAVDARVAAAIERELAGLTLAHLLQSMPGADRVAARR